ncbi:hypothetical protein [Fictibacillus sp. UD]|uniref:hypothetical protein n=1 Tax=Fictibacillus sp. UD TaxID=3038777 RepID=UPI003747F482
MRDSSKIKLQIFFVRCVAAEAFLVLRDRRAVRKSGSGSFSPDKQKLDGFEGALCLLSHLTFDLEGLATATRQVRHLKVKRYQCGSPPAPRKASI